MARQPAREAPDPKVNPHEIVNACTSLAEIGQHLRSVARLGGGDVTAGLLQAAIDDCPDGVMVTDRRAQIVMVNGAIARMLRISTRELQTLTVWDITHVSSQHDFDVLWREFLRAGRQRGTYTLRDVNADPLDVAYCAQTDVIPDRHVVVVRKAPIAKKS